MGILNKQIMSWNGARRVHAMLALNFVSSPSSRWASKSLSSTATVASSSKDDKCDKRTDDTTWSDSGERAFHKQSDITKRLRLMLQCELRDGMEIAKQLPTGQTRTFENVNSLTYVEYKPQRRTETVRAQSTQNWSNNEKGRRMSRNAGLRMDTGGGLAINNKDFFKMTSKAVNGAEQMPIDKSLNKSVK